MTLQTLSPDLCPKPFLQGQRVKSETLKYMYIRTYNLFLKRVSLIRRPFSSVKYKFRKSSENITSY